MSVQGSSLTSIAGGLSSRQSSLLWMLAVAAERGAPLVDELDALADDERGGQRKRLRDLADMLRAGLPLPEAVQNIPGLLPRNAIFAVRAGCETGKLGPALRSVAEGMTADYQEEQHGNKVYLFYCLCLLFCISMVSGFLLYYIVPKFEVIFRDFDLALPESTEMMIAVAQDGG